jgi:hypothetical protein
MIKRIVVLLCILAGMNSFSKSPDQNFDRLAFYQVFANGKLADINTELEVVKSAMVQEKEAFEGSLLMKKAGLMAFPGDKLSFFKSGRKKLESSIQKDDSNAEFRFLRFVIQENAPGIVNYRENLQEDLDYIRKSFKSLPKVVQDAVSDYSKKSKLLHPGDF